MVDLVLKNKDDLYIFIIDGVRRKGSESKQKNSRYFPKYVTGGSNPSIVGRINTRDTVVIPCCLLRAEEVYNEQR